MRLIMIWYFMILGKITMPLKMSEMFVQSLETMWGPDIVHVSKITREGLDAHPAARAPPLHRKLIADHTASGVLTKWEKMGVRYPKLLVTKWKYVWREYEDVIKHLG
jgi:hypothetical protein